MKLLKAVLFCVFLLSSFEAAANPLYMLVAINAPLKAIEEALRLGWSPSEYAVR